MTEPITRYATSESVSVFSQESCRILVVDHDADHREILAFVLEDMGCCVTTVADGYAALAKIGSQRPDLVIADVITPRMSGEAFARELKLIDKSLPLVVLTADPDAEKGKTLANEYLTEPLNLDELRVTVQRFCPKPGASRAPRVSSPLG